MNEPKHDKNQPRTLDNRRKTLYSFGGAYLIYTAVRLWQGYRAADSDMSELILLLAALAFLLIGLALLAFVAVKSVREYKQFLRDQKEDNKDE